MENADEVKNATDNEIKAIKKFSIIFFAALLCIVLGIFCISNHINNKENEKALSNDELCIKNGHVYEWIEEGAPTRNSSGYKVFYCSVCNKIIKEYPSPKLLHDYENNLCVRYGKNENE